MRERKRRGRALASCSFIGRMQRLLSKDGRMGEREHGKLGKVARVGHAPRGRLSLPSALRTQEKYPVHRAQANSCVQCALTLSLFASQPARNCFLCHRKLPYKNIVPGLQLRPTPRGRRRRWRRRRRSFALGDVGRTLVRRSRVWQQGAVQLRSTVVDAVIEKGTVGVSDNHCN